MRGKKAPMRPGATACWRCATVRTWRSARSPQRWEMDAAVLHREYPKAREEFKRVLMDVVRDLQGGGPEAVEEECTRLLGCFS